MKKTFSIALLLALLCMTVASCLTAGQVATWLESQKGVPTINITGEWDAGWVIKGGWGGVNVVQQGNQVVGTMGLYNVEGVVNGNKIYLVLKSGSRIYYTASLQPDQEGNLVGTVAEKAIIDTKDALGATKYPMIIKKIRNNTNSRPQTRTTGPI